MVLDDLSPVVGGVVSTASSSALPIVDGVAAGLVVLTSLGVVAAETGVPDSLAEELEPAGLDVAELLEVSSAAATP